MLSVAALLALSSADTYNCTKAGCWFSYTNPKDTSDGRCGEVDAASRMPDDMWGDEAAVQEYVKYTIELYQVDGTLRNTQCNHDIQQWVRNGTAKVPWTTGNFLRAICPKKCGCGDNPFFPCKDEPDDQKAHRYCSLCGPTDNKPIEIQLWYPINGPGPSGKTIVDLAVATPDLSALVSALKAGGLVSTLSGAGPFTVFAPTNEAFAKLPAATLAHLLDPKNIKELDDVLEYHVIAGAIYSKDLKTYQMVKTLEGKDVKIVKAGRVVVQNATVTSADNAASNGVVHIIDGVLVPSATPGPAPAPPAPSPGPGPGPVPTNHLWFRGWTGGGFDEFVCGEVDAAPRLPAEIFDPSNAAALRAYEDVTIALFSDYVLGVKDNLFLELGRCSDNNYTTPKSPNYATADWAPDQLMDGICQEKCKCDFKCRGKSSTLNPMCTNSTSQLPTCKDEPDDPKAAKWCSLCGPKYNAPVTVFLFTCKEGGLGPSHLKVCPTPAATNNTRPWARTQVLMSDLLARL